VLPLSAEMLGVAGRIAAKTGCKLLSEWANARQDAGRVVSLSQPRAFYPN